MVVLARRLGGSRLCGARTGSANGEEEARRGGGEESGALWMWLRDGSRVRLEAGMHVRLCQLAAVLEGESERVGGGARLSRL